MHHRSLYIVKRREREMDIKALCQLGKRQLGFRHWRSDVFMFCPVLFDTAVLLSYFDLSCLIFFSKNVALN